MIQKFIDLFEKNKSSLEQKYGTAHPESYREIVKDVISILGNQDDYGEPDPDRIVEIDHGHYQGTLLYVIGAEGYQPSDYWYVMVSYGSCSACDTLHGIRTYFDEDKAPTEEQVKDYMTLALHIVQGIRKMYPAKDE